MKNELIEQAEAYALQEKNKCLILLIVDDNPKREDSAIMGCFLSGSRDSIVQTLFKAGIEDRRVKDMIMEAGFFLSVGNLTEGLKSIIEELSAKKSEPEIKIPLSMNPGGKVS